MFPERLRQLRKAAGLTQKELGQLVGLDDTTISSYERGISTPNHDLLTRLADVLRVSVDYLLGRTDNTARTRLQRLREEAGLSHSELAEQSGVVAESIARYEAGEKFDEMDLVKLATALNVSASYLRGTSNDPRVKTQLPPDLEQLVDEILQGGWTARDVRVALQMLELARDWAQGRGGS